MNAEYGECETKTAMLLRGWTYEVRMFHAGTNIEDGSPDYDYSLSCTPPSCIGIVTNDFHIFRALATARHVSALNFSGIPAPSTGYGFTHYAMREFFAVGAGLIKGELSF